MKNKREKHVGLIIAAVICAGLALSGVAIVRDGPESLSLRRTPDLPVPASTPSGADARQARGQYIDTDKPDLAPEYRRGLDWTGVPATPKVVPQVRYADGERVPQADVSKVLGYEGEKIRRPRSDGDGAPLSRLPEPVGAEEFWSGLGDIGGSPADVRAIPGQ
ncbi:MAG: hypothetical protein ACE5JM_05290 [Armatimonadota bacterium]